MSAILKFAIFLVVRLVEFNPLSYHVLLRSRMHWRILKMTQSQLSEEDIKQILAKQGFLISVWESGEDPTPIQIGELWQILKCAVGANLRWTGIGSRFL